MADKMGIPRDEILATEPGRLLDALVAEYVVGIKEHRKAYPESFDERVIWFRNPPNVTAYYVPFYSTDISAAWEVVEMFSYIDIHRYDDFFACAIYPIGNSAVIRARGKTMPEAICKAALLAVMDGEDKHGD